MGRYDQDFKRSNNNLSNFYLDEENDEDVSDSSSLHSVLLQITCEEKCVQKKNSNGASNLITTHDKNDNSNDKV